MSDCAHSHIKCMQCFRDLKGSESHIAPVTQHQANAAIERIWQLEHENADLKRTIEMLLDHRISGIKQRERDYHGVI